VHIELTTIVVNDYDDAIHFFQHILGFDLVDDSPSLTNDGRAKRWVVVRPPGAVTGHLLAKADGPTQLGGRPPGSQPRRILPPRRGLRHRPHADGRCRSRVHHCTRDEPYGRVAVFCDISGNRWDLVLRSAGAALPDGGAQELVDSCPTLLGQRFAVDQHQCGYTVVFTVMAQPMTVLPAPGGGTKIPFSRRITSSRAVAGRVSGTALT